MDDEWDADDFVPPPPVVAREQPKSQWDDEDKEEEDVKESWEDEEKQAATEAAAIAAATVAAKPKTEKKGKKAAAAAVNVTKEKEIEADSAVAVDPLTEKLRQQRLVEEADYQVTTELFGGAKSLEGVIPKSEGDFIDYGELIASKITPFEKSFHYMTLLRTIMKSATKSVKAADTKDLASALTVIANEKLKAEKEASAGKKKSGAKKKQLHVDKGEEESGVLQAYDDVDDYDFM